MPSPTVIVENLLQDTLRFQTVTNPAATSKDGKDKVVETFTLELGSTDDIDEETGKVIEGKLPPIVPVPEWALEQYRQTTWFKHLESTTHIKVSRAA